MSYCYFVKLNNESGLVFTVGCYCAKFAKFDLCISPGRVATRLRCGEKYDERFVARLLLSERIFKRFEEVMNEYRVTLTEKRTSTSPLTNNLWHAIGLTYLN